MPVPATAKSEAQLLEVFSSIQGEGILIGWRQIFVRMAYCNLSCAYCDTPFEPLVNCRIEDAPGSGNFNSFPNPVALETLYNILFQWEKEMPGGHHSISLTGGEPLVQAETLEQWLPSLKKLFPIHLETNGTLADALKPLLPHLDWVSTDIKLPSQTKSAPVWDAHRKFLSIASSKPGCVKMVVGEDTPFEEVETAARLVSEVAPQLPLIIQPVTKNGQISMSARTLIDLHSCAVKIHPKLKIIPQTHRFVGML